LTLVYLKGRRIEAQSSDTKPAATELPAGWKLHELDTGRVFLWDGAQWIFLERTEESKNKNALQPRSSIHQLFGDTFAKTAASSVFLLEGLTDEQGGTSLTNNGSIDLTRIENDLPLRGFKVPSLNGTTQYFSIPTESKVQVGLASFAVKGEFKTNLKSTFQALFFYGSESASEQNWYCRFNSSNQLEIVIDDGTNTATIVDSVKDRWQDDKIHTIEMFVDRTADIMKLLVDGEEIGSVSISAVTGTLDNVGTVLSIGARFDGSASIHFNGELSNFQLYKMTLASEDYPLIPLLSNPQLRESALGNNAFTLGANTSARINNRFFSASAGSVTDKFFTVINTSEGFYDLIDLYVSFAGAGIQTMKIDGITVQTVDHYSASTTFNQKATAKGIFISSGSHLFSLESPTKNAASTGFEIGSQMLELIKRDGEYNESDEATSGLLTIDELLEKETMNGSLTIDTGNIFNTKYLDSTVAVTEFLEGRIFIKKGNYKITTTAHANTTFPTFSLLFGGVKVLDNTTAFDITEDENHQETRFAFLEGGETPVKLLIDSIATGVVFDLISIRFELVSGKGNGDEVTIFASDDNFEDVNGSGWVLTIDTAQRFNHFQQISAANANDLDERIVRIYLSGGTYNGKLVYSGVSNAGILDLGIDSDSTGLLSQFDTVGAANNLEKAFTFTTSRALTPPNNKLKVGNVVFA